MLTSNDVKRVEANLKEKLEELKANNALYARGEEVGLRFALDLILGIEEINTRYNIKEDK